VPAHQPLHRGRLPAPSARDQCGGGIVIGHGRGSTPPDSRRRSSVSQKSAARPQASECPWILGAPDCPPTIWSAPPLGTPNALGQSDSAARRAQAAGAQSSAALGFASLRFRRRW
jgi:hypothetical protein